MQNEKFELTAIFEITAIIVILFAALYDSVWAKH
tara:strand:+ start:82213 stop:82314 length:102 start_codon:yes stop_codon:yes gene_type:complete